MAFFGGGSVKIWLGDVGCSGTETRLIDCSYRVNILYCDHTEDAGVRCALPGKYYATLCNSALCLAPKPRTFLLEHHNDMLI